MNLIKKILNSIKYKIRKSRYVYCMASFNLKDNGSLDIGYYFLFPTLKAVEKYIDHMRAGKDDAPFERRWRYLVVERVFYGPYATNEKIGFWMAVFNDEGCLSDVIKLPDTYQKFLHLKNVINLTIGS